MPWGQGKKRAVAVLLAPPAGGGRGGQGATLGPSGLPRGLAGAAEGAQVSGHPARGRTHPQSLDCPQSGTRPTCTALVLSTALDQFLLLPKPPSLQLQGKRAGRPRLAPQQAGDTRTELLEQPQPPAGSSSQRRKKQTDQQPGRTSGQARTAPAGGQRRYRPREGRTPAGVTQHGPMGTKGCRQVRAPRQDPMPLPSPSSAAGSD